MTSVFVWVLTITVWGNPPIYKTINKYTNKQECQQALELAKQEYAQQGRQSSGACVLSLKENRQNG